MITRYTFNLYSVLQFPFDPETNISTKASLVMTHKSGSATLFLTFSN